MNNSLFHFIHYYSLLIRPMSVIYQQMNLSTGWEKEKKTIDVGIDQVQCLGIIFLKNRFAEVLIQSFKFHELGLRVLPWLKWTCYNLCKQVEHDIQVHVVLKRTVAGSDWHFDNLCVSHLQGQSELMVLNSDSWPDWSMKLWCYWLRVIHECSCRKVNSHTHLPV